MRVLRIIPLGERRGGHRTLLSPGSFRSHIHISAALLCHYALYFFFAAAINSREKSIVGDFGVVRAITPNEKIKQNRRRSELSLEVS